MMIFGKFKHCGVNYRKSDPDLIFRKNEVLGDQELKWSMIVIFNNLKALFKASNNISKDHIQEVGSMSQQEKVSVTDFLIPSDGDSESSESEEYSESLEEDDADKVKDVRYSKLLHMFRYLK